MKRIFSVYTVLVVISLLLASCAQPTEEPSGPSPTEVVEEEPTEAEEEAEMEEEEPTESPEEAEEVVELVYMRQAEGIDLELEFVEEFNQAHPNINVVVDSVPAGETYSKLALTTESGNPPDVFMTYWTLGAASNGLAMDLTPFIEPDGHAFFTSYVKPGWTFNAYAGKYYGAPYRVAPVSVIINKNMVDAAGLDLPPNDWTWEDFVEYGKALTNEEEGEYGYCLTGSAESHGTDAQFYPFLFSAGGKMINENGLAGFNSPEGVEALEFMTGLVQEGEIVPPGTTSASNNTCIDMLAADKVAMWIDASIWLGFIRAGRPEVNITLATMPYRNVQSTDNGGTGFGISPLTEHPEEAWEFVKFLISDDVMKRWAMAGSFTPGNVNVLNDPEFLENPENAKVKYMLDNYKIWPLSHYPDNANLESVLRTYLQAAYLGDMTPEEALDGAAAEWNTVLEDYQEDDWWDVWK